MTTGAYSVRYMAYKGFQRIALMGIDLRYVEILPEARGTKGVGLVMAKTPDSNPNYFFDSYQQEGDLFNIPNPAAHEGNLHLRSFELVRDDFAANNLQIDIFNTNSASLLAEAGVFPYMKIDTILAASASEVQPRLGAVVIPCTDSDVDQIIANFHAWSSPSYAPFIGRARDRPALCLVFNNSNARKQIKRIEKAFASLPVRNAFARLEITFLDLRGTRDAYVRSHKVTDSPHGYKAGPNNLFFGAIAHARRFGRYSFMMESDCVPVRPGWLRRLQAIVETPDTFWVAGSAYRGQDQIGREIARHINGNAIYACGDPAFQSFLENVWKPALQKIVRSDNPRAAYDFVLDYLQQEMRSDVEKNAPWDFWRDHAHLFRYTDYIVNISGNADLNSPRPDMVLRALRSETTFIVHSAPLALAIKQTVDAGDAIPVPTKLRPVRIPRQVALAGSEDTLRFSHFVPTGDVRREGDIHVIAGAPDSNNLKSVLAGAINPGDHITASVTILVDSPTTIRAGLARHDSTSKYESSPFLTLNLSAGEQSFSLEHTFMLKHAACRVQIASATGEPVRVEMVKVEARREKRPAKPQATSAQVKPHPVTLPHHALPADSDNILRFSHFVPTGDVRREGDIHVIAGAPDSNNLKSVLAGAINPGDHITANVTILVDSPTTIRAGLARHDSTSKYESSPFPTLTLSAREQSFSLEHTFMLKHAACRVQIASATGEPVRVQIVKIEAKREPKQIKPQAIPAPRNIFGNIFHRLSGAVRGRVR